MMGDEGALVARVCGLMPGWQPDELAGFTYLPLGYSNDNYRFRQRGEDFVLRVPLDARHPDEWRLERDFYAAPGHRLVPEVITFDINSGAMISRWVEGPMLIDAPPDPKRLVAYLRTLHRDLAPSGRVYDPVARSRKNLATPGPNQPSPRVERLVGQMDWPRAGLAACHNDFNPWNVIRTPDESWVTLDWESHGNNDPLFDLVTMHQGLALDDGILHGLCEGLLGASVAPGRVEQVRVAFWVREYAWAFSQWQLGNHREELQAQMRQAEERLM